MKRLSTALLFAFLFALPSLGSAQWSMVAPNLLIPHEGRSAITFHDGIIYLATSSLYISKDSGATWSLQGSNRAFNDPAGVADDIHFFDANHGIASTAFQLYSTSDGGITWNQLNANLGGHSCAFGSSPNILLAADGAAISTDAGITWANTFSLPDTPQVCLSGSNGAFLVLSGSLWANRGKLYTSIDRGATWTTQGGSFDLDSWSLAIDSCEPEQIYVANEDVVDSRDGLAQVFVTTNSGVSWQPTFSRSIDYLTGGLALSKAAVYCQTIDSGIIRSTDRGTHWLRIGGPSNDYDSRMIAAINDNLIIAADANGNIWRTLNSGGDSISAIIPTPLSSRDTSTNVIGETVFLPIIYIEKDSTTSIDLNANFDTTGLVYVGAFAASGTKDLTTSYSPGIAHIHFTNSDLHPTDSAGSDSIIGYAEFRVFPQYTPCSTVTFDSITIGAVLQNCESIPPITTPFKAQICDPAGCGAPAMSDLLRYGKVPIISILPNPAGDHFAIQSDVVLGTVQVSVYDLLGALRFRTNCDLAPGIQCQIQTAQLPSGSYTISISSPTFRRSLPLSHVH